MVHCTRVPWYSYEYTGRWTYTCTGTRTCNARASHECNVLRGPAGWRFRRHCHASPSSTIMKIYIDKGREDPCRKTDVGRRFSCALPVIFGVTEPVWLPKTSYCTFGHDHILKCPNVQWTDIHLDKDMERERGRKGYFVHTMRQDVAILCYKYNTIATKPVSGPLLEGER